jgi:hypothetical protein
VFDEALLPEWWLSRKNSHLRNMNISLLS